MMTKERFKELVYLMEEHNELYDKLGDLGIDVMNCKEMEIPGLFFDEIMRNEFGEDGLDLIVWWMYEDVDHKIYENTEEMKELYYPGEEIHGRVIADLNNIDDLYDYISQGGRDELNEE